MSNNISQDQNESNKLNWNGLTDREQENVERIVNREVFTQCNQLIDTLSKTEYIEFENEYDSETDEHAEIFTFFIVSEWLYDKLRGVDAVTAEVEGLYIWGRCDFNQGLDMNSDLKEVARNITKAYLKVVDKYKEPTK